jgi:Zn-dependent protease with chaperone function
MLTVAGALALIAVGLAWPVPVALARAVWPRHHPAGALLLWQAIGLGGGLTLLAAELSLAAAGGALEPLGILAFAVTLVWLLFVLVRSALRVAAARRGHRALLDLVAEPAPDATGLGVSGPGGTTVPVEVLAHAEVVAYSVPGLRSRIVISEGVRTRLAPDELAAVIAHERAHLRQHHDIVVQPFVAWRRSFPFLPAAAEALRAVERLTEYLADDAARQLVGPDALVTALDRLPGEDVAARRARLLPVH